MTDKTLAVYCWAPHIQAEGINAVLDNLQDAGVGAVSTTTYVAAPAEPGPGVHREPPDNGSRGLSRIIDRPLWGKPEQYLRTGPAFEHNRALYADTSYAPGRPNDLTAERGHVVADFISAAKRRGIKTFMQISPSGRPLLRPGVSGDAAEADSPRLPDGSIPGERMEHFPPIASPDLQAYNVALVKDVLGAYPELDGLLLDRMEQAVYSFDDAFLDFGPHSERFATENGFDFEVLRSGAISVLDGIRRIGNDDLVAIGSGGDIAYVLTAALRDNPALGQLLSFRSALTTAYLSKLRAAADSVRPGVQLLPLTFPPPMSLLTGADFGSFTAQADALVIKFFTMHWPLIVTYWAQSIVALNPSLDAGLVARTVSILLDMEDEPSSNLEDYQYPGPQDAHRAGTRAQQRKIEQTTVEAGGVPVLPSVHAYGPMDDVERRWRIGWETGRSGMWVNRYGYLSDEKLALLKRVTD